MEVGGRLYFAYLFLMSQVDGGFQILAYVIPEGGKKETREPILALKFFFFCKRYMSLMVFYWPK